MSFWNSWITVLGFVVVGTTTHALQLQIQPHNRIRNTKIILDGTPKNQPSVLPERKKKEKKNHNQVMMEYSQDIVRLGRKGRMEEALHLYESISKPSVRVWNSALDACARSAKMERAFAVFQEGIAQKNLRPNVFTFGSLMSACARARHADRAIQLLRSMKVSYMYTFIFVLCCFVLFYFILCAYICVHII